MERASKISYSVCLLAMCVVTTPVLAAPKYVISDLGAGVIPVAIMGIVVSAKPRPEAFLYRRGAITRLGQLGGTASWGLGVSDLGAIFTFEDTPYI